MSSEPNRHREPPRIEGSASLSVVTLLLILFGISMSLAALAAYDVILTATVYEIVVGAVTGVFLGGLIGGLAGGLLGHAPRALAWALVAAWSPFVIQLGFNETVTPWGQHSFSGAAMGWSFINTCTCAVIAARSPRRWWWAALLGVLVAAAASIPVVLVVSAAASLQQFRQGEVATMLVLGAMYASMAGAVLALGTKASIYAMAMRYRSRALRALSAGRFRLAVHYLDDALETSSSLSLRYLRVHAQLAHAIHEGTPSPQREASLRGAVSDLLKALDEDSIGALADYARGRARLDQGDGAAAVAAFDKVVSKEPNNPVARLGRALGHALQGDAEAATVDYHQACQLRSWPAGLGEADAGTSEQPPVPAGN